MVFYCTDYIVLRQLLEQEFLVKRLSKAGIYYGACYSVLTSKDLSGFKSIVNDRAKADYQGVVTATDYLSTSYRKSV